MVGMSQSGANGRLRPILMQSRRVSGRQRRAARLLSAHRFSILRAEVGGRRHIDVSCTAK
jgi:hypothetical protein